MDSDLYQEAQQAVAVFNNFISQYELNGSVRADHICYKCESTERFESLRGVLEQESRWFHQGIFAGRRIAVIGINEVLETSAGQINVLELSDQKPDGSQRDGFDHIEIYPVRGTYDELVSYLEEKGLDVKKIVRPHHTTHDIRMDNGFIVRLTREPLVEKIKEEMN